MEDSILTSVKKVCNIVEDYNAFDEDILMHINSIFSSLTQLGVGPTEGFMIEDDSETWTDYIGEDKKMQFVKTYVALKVRLIFDPPQSSSAVEAMNNTVKELEWRLNLQHEL